MLRWFKAAEYACGIEAFQCVGIVDSCKQLASTLSVGQQRRVTIARAMVQGAKVILGLHYAKTCAVMIIVSNERCGADRLLNASEIFSGMRNLLQV